MAAKYPMAEPHGLKKVMKPVISTDVMGNRNVEVKAVGAWAEPATFFSQIRVPDAVWAAQREEEKIAVMQKQKEQRLRQFQQDVKKRVRHMNKVKRKQQLEKDFELMEKEHKLVQRSLKSSEHMVGQKDHVMQQVTPSVSIKQSSAAGLQDEPFEGGRNRKVFNEHNEQQNGDTSAWSDTTSRIVRYSALEVEVLQEVLNDKESDDEDFGGDDSSDSEGEESDENQHPPLLSELAAEGEGDSTFDPGDVDIDMVHTFTSQARQKLSSRRLEDVPDCDSDSDMLPGGRWEKADQSPPWARPAWSELQINDISEDKEELEKFRHAQSRRPTSAPDLRVGATEEAERKRRGQQMLNYRRLYSDLERQTVRENDRRKKQRSQIYKIKKEKEEWRKFEEDQARRLVEPRDPVTGETCLETNLREQYLDALRKNLREKLTKQGRELPPLCCCGETLWDTHPDTCANNCFFYKNHRAYARALQSMLTSSEVM
ncbi:hypothetical protein BaRGS_00011679 [Batillaria attramentaria]|uniref:Coiled-coil domain-containing protein 15 n=1 Tax=Batillaria attramentaria TaxID=370345 RepID=A0ABD0LCH8_9CAEN